MYAYINTHQNTYETNHDILGYIDKDVEKYYTYKDGISTNNLSNIELEEGDK
jgi:hypothetical protein